MKELRENFSSSSGPRTTALECEQQTMCALTVAVKSAAVTDPHHDPIKIFAKGTPLVAVSA